MSALQWIDRILDWRANGRHSSLRIAIAAGVTFVGEWLGITWHRGRLPTWDAPRSIAVIWWHFPLWAALFAVAFLGRFRARKTEPDEEPTTLDL